MMVESIVFPVYEVRLVSSVFSVYTSWFNVTLDQG
jgi:hypothetical protein